MYNKSQSLSPLHLRVQGLSFSYPDRRVLTDVSFTVSAEERIGLIGENGSGKTTLLKVAAGLLEPSAGQVQIVGDGQARIGLLQQDAPFAPGLNLRQTIEAAVAGARLAAANVDSSASLLAEHPDDGRVQEEYSQALLEAERLDAWGVDTRIEKTLAGLGLAAIPEGRLVAEMSGGQRARLALAWVLLTAPQILLLDEPTNHLDAAATDFLLQVLGDWKGPVLLASHDRTFLDRAVTGLLDLDPAPTPVSVGEASTGGAGCVRFSGRYSEYLQWRKQTRQSWWAQYEAEQSELKKLRAGLRDSHQVGHSQWKPKTETRMARKFYGDRNAKVVARRVNDARSRLSDLEAKQIRKPPQELSFAGLSVGSEHSQRPAADFGVSVSDVSVAGRLDRVSFTVGPGEKLLITGANGSGKSTLMQVLKGNLATDTGTVSISGSMTRGLLGQEAGLADPFDRGAERTVLQTYIDLAGADAPSLSQYGLLYPRDFNRRLDTLSRGQQRRLELAILIANPPDLLLLDEPSNHLSLTLVTALEEAVAEYPGIVIISSHDRWLRENWKGQTLELR